MSDIAEVVKELRSIRWTVFWMHVVIFCIWLSVGPCTQADRGGIKVQIVQPQVEQLENSP